LLPPPDEELDLWDLPDEELDLRDLPDEELDLWDLPGPTETELEELEAALANREEIQESLAEQSRWYGLDPELADTVDENSDETW
jgi:hypothetical protein